jgi:hypothetical protein
VDDIGDLSPEMIFLLSVILCCLQIRGTPSPGVIFVQSIHSFMFRFVLWVNTGVFLCLLVAKYSV